MFGVVLWMNLNLSMIGLMMILEIVVGTLIYMALIFVMRANLFGIIKVMIGSNFKMSCQTRLASWPAYNDVDAT